MYTSYKNSFHILFTSESRIGEFIRHNKLWDFFKVKSENGNAHYKIFSPMQDKSGEKISFFVVEKGNGICELVDCTGRKKKTIDSCSDFSREINAFSLELRK